MKRIVVAISLTAMNQWDVLEQGSIIDGYEVIFHNDPRMTIKKDRTMFNFDIAIDDGNTRIDGFLMSAVVPSDRLITIPRFNKVEQHLRIRTAVDDALLHDINLSNFISIDIYHNSQTNGNSHLLDITDPVVVKPLDGARGIGQFLIHHPSSVLLKVVDALTSMRKGNLEVSDVFDKLEPYKDGFTYSTAGERMPDEGLLAIKGDGICIQGFVPGIVYEYRLITDANCKVTYCQKRDIRQSEGGFPQAVGSSGTSDDEVPALKAFGEDDLEAIEYLAKAVVGPCSSIDVFVTDDRRWGFFEYCNQFGIVGVRTRVVKEICEGLLRKTIAELDL